jgi:acyl-CoA thioester hydrolase
MSEAVDLADRANLISWTNGIVRYSDLDPNGHVNNGAVNTFFEDGRVHFRRSNFNAAGEAHVLAGYVIVDFHALYLTALNFPGEVEVGTSVLRIGTSSFTLGQAIFQNGKCAATAEVTTVCTDPANGKARPMAEDFKEILRGLLAPGLNGARPKARAEKEGPARPHPEFSPKR